MVMKNSIYTARMVRSGWIKSTELKMRVMFGHSSRQVSFLEGRMET